MNVWIIQSGENLPFQEKARKIRTAILADKLVERNHKVLWWTSAFDHFNKDWIVKQESRITVNNGLKIIALKGVGYKKNISFLRLIDNRIIAWKFRKLAMTMPKPDIIIANTPPYEIVYNTIIFAKSNNIPVVVDIRDCWPDTFFNHITPGLHQLAKIFLYKDFQMIKKIMEMATGLIGVSNTFLDWGLGYAKRNKTWKDRVFYLGCKNNLNSNNIQKSSKFINDFDFKNKFVVTFIGTFSVYHDPSILLECAEKLSNSNIYFVLAGDGELFNKIKKRASTLQNVLLPGWLNHDEISTLLQNSHVGVCPANKNIDLFPNKAFAYFSANLPIISAFYGDLKEIIEKYQIGFFYPANDANALVTYIKKLHEDKDLYKEMSDNVQNIFNDKFDAEKIYNDYVDHIEAIGGCDGRCK